MIRVLVRVRDKSKVNELEKFGVIIYKSPILNVIALEIDEKIFDKLEQHANVLSCEVEPEGRLMPV
jgi:hypothetical protein